MKKIAILAMALCTAATAFASVQPNRRLAPGAKMAAAKARMINAPDFMVDAYLSVDSSVFRPEMLESMGVKVTMNLGDIVTARVPLQALGALGAIPGIEYVQTPSGVRQMLDVARPEIGQAAVQAGKDLPSPFTGSGVVVGIVDNGYDYTHAAFTDSEGRLRIKRVWEQSTEPFGTFTSPERFGYGTEITDPAALLEIGGDVTTNSHGTHVASIAAGSDNTLDGALRGMAPDADIVLVSMLQGGTSYVNISNAIAYIFDYADRVGKPCVVNLSLGAHSGPHDGTSPFDAIADRLQGPGRLIVGASGNFTDDTFHIRHQFNGADDAPLRSFIGYKTSGSTSAGSEIEVWSSQGAEMEVALLVYKTTTGEVAERIVVSPSASDQPQTVSLGRNVSGNFLVATEVNPINGKQHTLLTTEVKSVRTGFAIAIEVKPHSAGTVDIWADDKNLELQSRDIEGFTSGTGFSTLCEIGGTANRILTVGAYTTRSEYLRLGETSTSKLNETDGDIASFSCYGPTADGRMKPQITAPGCFISAAVSSHDRSGTISYSHYHTDNGHDNFYGFMQGTSMATPMVTGVVATWLQAWPEMTPEDLAEIVAATARKDNFTGAMPQESNKWGFGKIDALAGIKQCITRADAGVIDAVIPSGAQAVPAVVTAATDGSVDVLFTASLSSAKVEVFSTSGATLAATSLSGVAAASQVSLDVPHTTSSVCIVRVTTPMGTASYKLRLR